MSKIFLLEDDKDLNESIKEALNLIGFEVKGFFDGEEASNAVMSEDFDFYIIDINVPKFNGIEVMKYIKEIKQDSKILIMSANTDLNSINKAYQIGCLDYLKKPFFIEELIYKIKIFTKETSIITITKDLIFNADAKRLQYKDKTIHLTQKESRLLKLLIKNNKTVVTKDQILLNVFEDSTIKENSIRTLIRRLRDKLPFKNMIKTLYKDGYILSLDTVTLRKGIEPTF